ncbi:MAG: ABC transporter permease [Planctomycetia bacterium]|nr:ABC transporter permease [Planctomycetia bacterium]
MSTLEESHSRSLLHRYRNEVGLLIAITVVAAFTTLMDPAYREKPIQNLQELLRQSSLIGIFALGAALVIISGGIDLSSGSVIAFSGVVCSSIMLLLAPVSLGDDAPKPLSLAVLAAAILGAMFVAFLIGTLHAWLITVVRLPPFVATLASLVGLRSLARILVPQINVAQHARKAAAMLAAGITDDDSSKAVSKLLEAYDPRFRQLGSTWWIPLAIFVVLIVAMWLLLSKTVIGRHLYALGGNEQAARLSGIRTDRLKWLAYVIGAMTASLAGVLYCSEVASADPETAGRGYELTAIAAAVVGGCSLQGGIGTVPGVVLGVLFLRVVIDAVAKLFKGGTADDFEGMIVGFLVVLAVAFNELRQSRGGRRIEFFPGALGALTILILAGLTGLLAALTVSARAGYTAGGVVLAGLVIARILKRRRATSPTPASEQG